MVRTTSTLIAIGLAIATIGGPAHAQRGGAISAVVTQGSQSLLDDLVKDGDFDRAADRAQKLFDFAVGYATNRETKAFVEAAFAQRLTSQLAQAKASDRPALLTLMRKWPKLARELAFAIDRSDDVGAAYALLLKLHADHGDTIGQYPELTAAICIVHDTKLTRRINENAVKATDATKLFDYFVKNRKKLLFGIEKVPTELLIWVVDSTAQIDEMQWALDKYEGDTSVGSRFFDIEYDYAHLRTGREKQVTRKGFTLPNIKAYGGVCADQAYFAMSVGKAIGVPSAYVVGQSAEVGHAWVGYLEARGRRAGWNFDVGRYEAYQGVRGNVRNPQTRKVVPDSFVSLLAELIGTRTADRHITIAMIDAALRLREKTKGAAGDFKPEYLGPLEDDKTPPPARDGSAKSQLALIETGLRANLGNARAWFAVRDLAKSGEMSLGQIRTWAGLVQKMTGRKYPDFTLTMLKPMIAQIQSPHEQSRLWDSAFGLFNRRKDLAAEVRIAQGELWEKLEQPRKAGKCYEDVLRRFVNDGPFAITALKRTEAMLVETGKESKVVELYASTWQRTQRPQEMAGDFLSQSNWYRIGKLYAAKLAAAGEKEKAADVLKQIGG
jgi:hypothetical protein